jgi:hypothetical protein
MGANMILTIGAILLFGTLLVNSNNIISSNSQIAAQNEYYISALSLAQSVVDEAKTKAFDQRTVSTGVASPNSMTRWDSLGKDAGETVPNPDTLSTSSPFSVTAPGYLSSTKFNDVDDYNDYKRIVNTPRAEGYNVLVKVKYASPTYPDSTYAASRSYCKWMRVYVWSKYMADTVKVYYSFLY